MSEMARVAVAEMEMASMGGGKSQDDPEGRRSLIRDASKCPVAGTPSR